MEWDAGRETQPPVHGSSAVTMALGRSLVKEPTWKALCVRATIL